VAAALTTATVATANGFGDSARNWLLCALTAVWGLCLATHIGLRSRGKGEDPRYERFLANAPATRTCTPCVWSTCSRASWSG
jgi:steroid 5-alpha reductase family enzyme